MWMNGKTSRIKSNTLSADSVQFVRYAEDPLQKLAELLLAQHAADLPDLSRQVVLLSHSCAIPRFRQMLLDAATERGCEALLPPFIGTMESWLHYFQDGETSDLLSTSAREVLLLEALAEHPQLYKTTPWPFIDSLLRLFDELSANHHGLPDNLTGFTQLLAKSYGINNENWGPLMEEARLAHSLWRAWRQQLEDNGYQDNALIAGDRLNRSLNQLSAETQLYLAGFIHFNANQVAWIKALHGRKQLTLLCHGQAGPEGYHPDAPVTELARELGVPGISSPAKKTAYSEFLDQVYALNDGDLQTRARRMRTAHPTSPARDVVAIFAAADAEHEARAIDLQVRRWWLQGKRNIGIVTNDRKLARRVRALLERANITLQDAAGWPLSTTSAATLLMRWLDTVEQNFAYAPLMDVLKSPFAFAGLEPEARTTTLSNFEREILSRENISSNLKHYQQSLKRHGAAMDAACGPGSAQAVTALFNKLESASGVLLALCDRKRHPAPAYLAALTASLQELSVTPHYTKDEAGQRLLAEIGDMQHAVSLRRLSINWAEFRAWLAHNLERHYFQPSMQGGGIEMMGFAESRLYRFDAVIIAGAHQDHLPGAVEYSAFFNDPVRIQLGLPTTLHQRCTLFYDFRRLLESAGHVLISLRHEEAGKNIIPSPWLERLRALHRMAYGNELEAVELRHLVASPHTLLAKRESGKPPGPEDYPAVRVSAKLIPTRLSASAHQRMLNCPYQYYAVHCLKLAEREPLTMDLEKSDYGQRVHRILQAFHGGIAGLPGPFSKTLSLETYHAAETLLMEISHAVFTEDIKRNFFAKGFLYRWLKIIPVYLDWQMHRAQTWKFIATECEGHEKELKEMNLVLTGRIDRLDYSSSGYSIIDYKTGAIPHLEEVESGEHIQLPFYTLLLAGPVREALFLALNQEGIKDTVRVEGATLGALSRQVETRLVTIHRSLAAGRPLPAWGDAQTCAYCAMESLCRKEMWRNEPSAPET